MCCTTPHHTTPHHTTLHHTTPHHTILHHTTLHYTTPHHTTPHYTTPHYTTLHYTTPHYTTLYHTTLHYTILHYTIPYYTTLRVCNHSHSPPQRQGTLRHKSANTSVKDKILVKFVQYVAKKQEGLEVSTTSTHIKGVTTPVIYMQMFQMTRVPITKYCMRMPSYDVITEQAGAQQLTCAVLAAAWGGLHSSRWPYS